MRSVNEKCAVIGVTNTRDFDVARLVYLGLWAMQHRGQDSSGIVSYNGSELKIHKKSGLVSQVYDESSLANLDGQIAIGHNRYSTSGGNDEALNQPYIDKKQHFAFAHNGNLPLVKKLKEYLDKNNIEYGDSNDSGLMSLVLANELKITSSIEESVRNCWPLFTGAFCCVGIYKDKMFAFRDHFGIRPLSLGKTNNGYIVASETAALDIIGADFVRDIKPGELVIIDGSNLEFFVIEKGSAKLDAFEFVYLARPDSRLSGKSVYSVRRRFGDSLAKINPVNADVVIAVPDSGTPAAVGYAQASGIPFELGIVKNRYIGRTFIEPEKIRKNSVELKFNVIVEIIAGKNVILVDDSLVRGNTLKFVVKILRQYGAKSVHVRIASPPVKYPDFYGIDTPKVKELIASDYSENQIARMINADTLAYLPLNNFIEAIEIPENRLCLACFNGIYPIPVK